MLLALAGCGGDSEEKDDLTRGDNAEWLFYGRDYQNSRANPDERRISRDTVGSLEKKWEWPNAPVTSTPVLAGDTLYFGTWDSAVQALDYKTGTVQWSSQLQDPNPINQISH
ncbi:MAG TPA: PQQ-binding-like beta-propeller repeat protein, partial [Polyangiaceae bacterium]|nr:PQQ-binding-like beta-propeller repeat protein [Polyangiaceae bacterium]